MIFSQDDLSDLTLTANKTNFIFINDGKWHRLHVERINRKVSERVHRFASHLVSVQLRFSVDDVEQSSVRLPDDWHAQANLFIGAELTPVPHGDFIGELGDVSERLCRVTRSIETFVTLSRL